MCPDIFPKGKKVKSLGNTHLITTDSDTRTILAQGIGPKSLKGSGSGKITSNVNATKAQANKHIIKGK